ncbi:MAG: nucleotidyl transferase AbiEii/AbiGii toxin family protein [Acidobacteria bacterium]|nr:nucleotidyl transferase AbiEii/AbiGii toxin family protein [Acidobacteriota bacterium]
MILEALAAADVPLVFKGGTCLAKVHSGFFRLSEDLDFSIPTAPDSTRGVRSRTVTPVKAVVGRLQNIGFELLVPLQGHNASTQYNATLGYRSLLAPRTETIAIEIGLREPTLTAPEQGRVHTAVLHWARGGALIETFPARCLSYPEAMAEKLRAALSRQEAAIRDFFDIDHAVLVAGLDVADPEFLRLVRSKLAVDGAGALDVSPERLDQLRPQLDAHLRPVLRAREFDQFDLDRAFRIVRGVTDGLGGQQ